MTVAADVGRFAPDARRAERMRALEDTFSNSKKDARRVCAVGQ
jgi:hypothetical protein